MNCERLQDQLALMGGRHREELAKVKRQHGNSIKEDVIDYIL